MVDMAYLFWLCVEFEQSQDKILKLQAHSDRTYF